ncbi:MAG: hypothetical protein RBR74_12120 [Ignavibacteriaceae bacterium]|jgi:hypothetical protein|nr:hypothetical protein [Ignavibacteriaceae bacterium]
MEKLADKYNNFYSFAFNEWDFGRVPGIMGTEEAMFMDKICKAGLNIIAAKGLVWHLVPNLR